MEAEETWLKGKADIFEEDSTRFRWFEEDTGEEGKKL